MSTTFTIFGDEDLIPPASDLNTDGPSDSPSFFPSLSPTNESSYFPSLAPTSEATLESYPETTSYNESYSYPTPTVADSFSGLNDTDAYYGYNDSSYGYNESSPSYGYEPYDESDPYGFNSDSDPYGYGGDSGYGGGGAYKKADYGDNFFYGVMSVAVLTLGLVVAVEAILHRIDNSAVGKPFMQAVLDAVYRELAVLGIVELGIHIMQQNYEYDKDKKAVFADVHFLLFYTDIFNAFQAVIQAYATNYVTQQLWVRTEELELDHYVEIREEYDRVHEELYGVPPATPTDEDESTKKMNKAMRKKAARSGWLNGLWNWITRPDLKLKYKQLLLQVRFHELRVHFLHAYQLPLQLKISDYLMRSEQNVMISLVHISPAAWLILTAICNVMYFLAGIIADVTGDSNATATFYSIVFFSGMVVFVVISLLMDKHMETIFHRIMKSKHLWTFHADEDDENDPMEDEELKEEQRSFFFMNNPNVVVTIIQFTQLGYAIALSVVLVYWGDMQKDEEFPAWPYLVSSVFFYGLFVFNMARVIPRFTLVANLGQLVDKELLRETVAMYKLKEAERQSTHTKEERENVGSCYHHFDDQLHMGAGARYKINEEATENISTSSDDEYSPVKKASSTESDHSRAADTILSPLDLVQMDTSALRDMSSRQRSSVRRKAMSEGVAMMREMTAKEDKGKNPSTSAAVTNSESLLTRNELESSVSSFSDSMRGARRDRRRSSQRAMSEGVAAMRQMTIAEEETENPTKYSRKKTLSGGVDNMQIDSAPSREMMLADLVKMDTKSVRNVVESSSTAFNDSAGSLRRSSRRKSLSDGVSAMASILDRKNDDAAADTAAGVAGITQRKKSNSASRAIEQMQLSNRENMQLSPKKDSPQNRSPATASSSTTTGFRLPFDPPVSDDGSIALSEVDDAHPSERPHWEEESVHEPFSLHKWLCEYFTGSTYRLTCHIGGTMICFFLVAMRVEGFVQKQCIIPEADYSWDLPLQWTFLLESAWLLGALGASLVVLLVYLTKTDDWSRNEWTSVIAAVLNVMLVGTCLGLLLGAESQRCCDDSEYDYKYDDYQQSEAETKQPYDRFLADYGKEEDVCKDATLFCKCEDFGFRVYGGLGNLEPWTALIALQVLRFILATKIADWYNLGEKEHHHDDHQEGHGHGHGHGHGASGPELIADAWQAAVAKHPELVEKYGEFSGEVLQAMLGLEVIERRRNVGYDPAQSDDEMSEKGNQLVVSGEQGALVTIQDEQYMSLEPEVQEIIAAGRVGMPVRLSCVAAAPMAPLEFEVDTQLARVESMRLTTTLKFPSARIIRSVRRCDRMYIPLLNKWSTVDVILTNHEIVYVDVNDDHGSMDDQKKRIANTRALTATGGGKGLRLCDITSGRKIVGRLGLDDITAVYVDRELPTPKDTKLTTNAIDVDIEESKAFQDLPELWQPGGDSFFDGPGMTERWEAVPQDKLHINTDRGTLYLRFYSDLKSSELHKDRHANEPTNAVHKDIAFQWAQTIVHLCAHQLKQSLPHFGENESEEFRDYLQLTSC